MYLLGKEPLFPDMALADFDGLLAVGGEMTVPWLDRAYKMGIFPWYDSPPIEWWTPDPRFVLFPDEFKTSKSLKKTIQKAEFEFKVDHDFEAIMTQCQQVKRKHESGTWINDTMIQSYLKLHYKGMAHCAGVYQEGELVAGLYGVRVGRVFSGESMFHHVRDMSKVCLALYIKHAQKEGVELIDCQVYTRHLASLGAREIPRRDFVSYLDTYDDEAYYRGPIMEV